ncbi:TetR family transcriptional regulator [Rathayibacter festucae]|uniref:TetR family transcriptional regulator n=1 Tax=Rathayibacter festucae DSM 15932 TaxID=1328866 RepID=A0A3T0T002_9MICO|nr:TetR family transcriptional regulator [Rathayibacter festucae]AZZ51889.1 TetR family transcriptional regulator [Rathayibacter festucae DSM 15932]
MTALSDGSPAAPTAKQRQAEATRTRLLDAAFDEFQRYGLAGARVDRIAEHAASNKRLIYVYFGDKEQLFDTVLVRNLEPMIDGVEFTIEDLPGYAANLFDYLEARPELLRLFAWRTLEHSDASTASEVERDSYRTKSDAIAEAQAAGLISSDLPGSHLLAAILALVQSWSAASPALALAQGAGEDGPDRRRQSVHSATARLIEVK